MLGNRPRNILMCQQRQEGGRQLARRQECKYCKCFMKKEKHLLNHVCSAYDNDEKQLMSRLLFVRHKFPQDSFYSNLWDRLVFQFKVICCPKKMLHSFLIHFSVSLFPFSRMKMNQINSPTLRWISPTGRQQIMLPMTETMMLSTPCLRLKGPLIPATPEMIHLCTQLLHKSAKSLLFYFC